MSNQATTANSSIAKKKALVMVVQDDTSEELKKQCLATALYEVNKYHTFYGAILSLMNIQYSYMVPTAGVTFSADNARYEMYINPRFFCKALTSEQRVAVLIHEICHITHKHLIRVPFMKVSDHKRRLLNIAGDMSINTLIKNLPQGCRQCPPMEEMKQGAQCSNDLCCGHAMFPANFSDEDKKTGKKNPWQNGKTMEFYFEKLMELYDEPEDGDGEEESKGSGNTPRQFDSHEWHGNAEESDVLNATEDLVKRAMVKQSLSYDDLPANLKDLLEDIKSRRAELNYRQLILAAIKRSATGVDRKYSWARKSRRFGNKAPGTKEGDLPKLAMYIDTSGSISQEEMNEFLDTVDEFLKVGNRKCSINLFSDVNYYSSKYKTGDREHIKQSVKMGGTCLESSLKHMFDTKSDLNIIITDGCYGDIKFENWLKPGQSFPQVLWIISRDGTQKHPLNRLGDTIQIPKGAK
jgi:predicted metal-dependent peptidase